MLSEEETFKKKFIGSLSQIEFEVFVNECSIHPNTKLNFHDLCSTIIEEIGLLKPKEILEKVQEKDSKMLLLCQKCEEQIFLRLKSLTQNDEEEVEDHESNEKSIYNEEKYDEERKYVEEFNDLSQKKSLGT